MLKKSLLFIIAIIIITAVFTGCRDSIEIIENLDVISSSDSDFIDGKFIPPVVKDGTTIFAEEGTFSSDAIVTLVEKKFDDKGSDYLANGDRIYELRGILKSDSTVSDSQINSIKKPVSVILRNSIAGNVKSYFVGTRNSLSEDWTFTQLDSVPTGNIRAYVNGSNVVYRTNRLGMEIALFAQLVSGQKVLPSTFVEKVSVTATSENEKTSQAGKIKIEDRHYCDNVKVAFKAEGSKVNNLGNSDFVAELIYLSNSSTGNIKITGGNAGSEKIERSAGAGDKFVHSVLISNMDGNSDSLNFILNTNKLSIDDFPMEFYVALRNSDNLTREALPFYYLNSVVLEELVTPKPPVNIVLSAQKIPLGKNITVTWEPGLQTMGLSYDIWMSHNGCEEYQAAEKLIERRWSPKEPLSVGSYSIRIIARNSDNQTASSEKLTFEVIAISGLPEIVNLKSAYNLGDPIEISWSEVSDPFGSDIVYEVNIDDSQNKIVKKLVGIAENYCKVTGLNIGLYNITVTAISESSSAQSSKQYFSVLEPKAPEIPSNLKISAERMKRGNNFTLTWDAVENIRYSVYIANEYSEQKVAENLFCGTWDSASLTEPLPIGDFSARVEAVNIYNLKSFSKPVNFTILTDEIPAAPVIKPFDKTVYLKGDPVNVAWNPVKDPSGMPISYNLWLYNSEMRELANVTNLNATDWTFNYLATDSYSVKIVATNGEDTSEPSVASFTVVAPTNSYIWIDENSIYACNYHAVDTEICIGLTEKNVEEDVIKNAINITGVDSSKVKMEFLTQGLKISFPDKLPLGQNINLAMAPIKDKYGIDVTGFTEYNFNTVPLEGRGTSDEPFLLGELTATRLTSEGKLPIIASMGVSVDCFDGMTFADASFVGDNTLIDPSEADVWKGLGVTNIDNNLVVDIPYYSIWRPNARGNVYMTFAGTLDGKTHYFKSAQTYFITETAKTISLGNGSAEDPFLLYSPQQLNEIRNRLDAPYHFKQMRDIDLGMYASGSGWTPIGDWDVPFCGIYDGCGRCIRGFCIKATGVVGDGELGLFGDVVSNGEAVVIKNLNFDSPTLESYGGNWDLACIAGYIDGNVIIENCHVTNGSVISNSSDLWVGGLVGSMYESSILNSSFNGQVVAFDSLGGGLVGSSYADNMTNIVDCQTSGRISGGLCGGIIAQTGNTSMIRCSSEMDMEAEGIIGGICGSIGGGTTSFEDCNSRGNYTSKNGNVGGIVGMVQDGIQHTFTRCSSSAGLCSINNDSSCGVGGIVGSIQTGTNVFNDCYSTSDIVVKESYSITGIGGLVGFANSGTFKFYNSYFKGSFDVPGGECVGGIIGFDNSSSSVVAENCYSEFDSITCYNCVGGFIGSQGGSSSVYTLTGCYTDFTKIETTRISDAYAAGFIGKSVGTLNCSKCYAKFDSVSGKCNNVGGFAGMVTNGSISNCYAQGSTVESAAVNLSFVGGFIGRNSYLGMNNCYTTAAINCDSSVVSKCGTFIGDNSSGQANSCFTTATSETYSLSGFGNSPVNCYSLTDGYDSSKDWGSYPWSSDIWDNLTDGSLPTLKI